MAPAPPGSQTQPLPSDLPFRLISKTIGTGAYAFIRKACPKVAPKPVIAVKFINKEHAFQQGRLTAKQLSMEITLHTYLGKHQNIIQCLGSGEDVYWTWIAMELAEGGDLFDKIEADEGVGEDIAHFYFTQLVNAVSFMHSKGVAHRDIKPENVLLSGEGDLKLADFGLAAMFKREGKIRLCNTVCGSPPYIAPEIVSGRRSRRTDLLDEGYAANVADIWSCGVVLFVLLVGNTPWDEPTMRSEEFKEYVETNGRTTDELWQKIPIEIVSLIRGMLKVDPKARFTLDEIRTHPWFTRSNPYLTASGTIANPIGLATHMLSSLRIDFTSDPMSSQSQRSKTPQADAMDLDSDNSMSNVRANLTFLSSTQPETPVSETPFDWERPPRLGMYDGLSASQPAISHNRPQPQPLTQIPFLSSMPHPTQDLLSQDPTLAQFTTNPSVPLTLTQAARQFRDILPNYSLARFLSPLSPTLLIPLLVEALHRLGVPVPPSCTDWERSGEAWIRVKMVDGRRQGLNGHMVVGEISVNGESLSEVRFVKASGDPVEWRRFFKGVVVGVGDVVLRPG
ncbi:Pkinase-domain-containing protein [Delitschia confertaspora ATCC 74209]|uniref:non-specific serine/threonine protein kinase n=1 Tax=Delitschia confertaspora ATCC 74209 TaxID=1513339 RepID=A0A9P4JG79_9PLEO|nr:Pkinase-domain-containing protein [Delitschia confertaspora ATCC 74209]